MHELELTRYANFEINALSGGTKQRVLIARALMHNPAIVILDEPPVGLDPDIRRKLWDQIKALKKAGITVILTTHYLDEAEILSDRICILSKGKVVMVESLQALKEKHQMASLEDIFLRLNKQENLSNKNEKPVAHNFFHFFALTRRNCKIIFKELSEPLVDGVILTGLNVLLFVYLFPAMGMPENLIAPIFLGSLLSMFFNLGFSLAVRIVLDIQYKRFIDYQLTLP